MNYQDETRLNLQNLCLWQKQFCKSIKNVCKRKLGYINLEKWGNEPGLGRKIKIA